MAATGKHAGGPTVAVWPIRRAGPPATLRVLLIEDSIHHQNQVVLLMTQRFAGVELHVADDGLDGLAMYGRVRPDVMNVEMLLPGIGGATLITSLRSNAQFAGSELMLMTSLSDAERAPYAFALQGVTVVHKPRLVADLPGLIERNLAPRQPAGGAAQDALERPGRNDGDEASICSFASRSPRRQPISTLWTAIQDRWNSEGLTRAGAKSPRSAVRNARTNVRKKRKRAAKARIS